MLTFTALPPSSSLFGLFEVQPTLANNPVVDDDGGRWITFGVNYRTRGDGGVMMFTKAAVNGSIGYSKGVWDKLSSKDRMLFMLMMGQAAVEAGSQSSGVRRVNFRLLAVYVVAYVVGGVLPPWFSIPVQLVSVAGAVYEVYTVGMENGFMYERQQVMSLAPQPVRALLE